MVWPMFRIPGWHRVGVSLVVKGQPLSLARFPGWVHGVTGLSLRVHCLSLIVGQTWQWWNKCSGSISTQITMGCSEHIRHVVGGWEDAVNRKQIGPFSPLSRRKQSAGSNREDDPGSSIDVCVPDPRGPLLLSIDCHYKNHPRVKTRCSKCFASVRS